MAKNNPRSTGYVARKIRANTARRNGVGSSSEPPWPDRHGELQRTTAPEAPNAVYRNGLWGVLISPEPGGYHLRFYLGGEVYGARADYQGRKAALDEAKWEHSFATRHRFEQALHSLLSESFHGPYDLTHVVTQLQLLQALSGPDETNGG